MKARQAGINTNQRLRSTTVHLQLCQKVSVATAKHTASLLDGVGLRRPDEGGGEITVWQWRSSKAALLFLGACGLCHKRL